jgi:hypothetical protein
MLNIFNIIKEEYDKILDEDNEFNQKEYLKWKRENVTLRGIQDIDNKVNSGFAKYGVGLYTAHLSNYAMAKEYGKVYFVVGARPKKPKKVRSVNDAENFIYYDVIVPYLQKNNLKKDTRVFYEHTTLEKEIINLGYDGLEISGREMVNYKPDNENIKYIEYTKDQLWLFKYYKYLNKIR